MGRKRKRMWEFGGCSVESDFLNRNKDVAIELLKKCAKGFNLSEAEYKGVVNSEVNQKKVFDGMRLYNEKGERMR